MHLAADSSVSPVQLRRTSAANCRNTQGARRRVKQPAEWGSSFNFIPDCCRTASFDDFKVWEHRGPFYVTSFLREHLKWTAFYETKPSELPDTVSSSRFWRMISNSYDMLALSVTLLRSNLDREALETCEHEALELAQVKFNYHFIQLKEQCNFSFSFFSFYLEVTSDFYSKEVFKRFNRGKLQRTIFSAVEVIANVSDHRQMSSPYASLLLLSSHVLTYEFCNALNDWNSF